MRLFNHFKKKNIDMINLPIPEDSIDFFLKIREISNQYWKETDINKSIFGYQIQPNTKWCDGLTESQIDDFENILEIKFPIRLRNFYKTMNGLDKPSVNVFGNKGEPYTYRPFYYSFPNDIELIRGQIEWIYSENEINVEKLIKQGASRIFPISGHRFMLIDEKTNPILSMHGKDIIYWTDCISKLLANDIFSNIENAWDFEANYPVNPNFKIWLND